MFREGFFGQRGAGDGQRPSKVGTLRCRQLLGSMKGDVGSGGLGLGGWAAAGIVPAARGGRGGGHGGGGLDGFGGF